MQVIEATARLTSERHAQVLSPEGRLLGYRARIDWAAGPRLSRRKFSRARAAALYQRQLLARYEDLRAAAGLGAFRVSLVWGSGYRLLRRRMRSRAAAEQYSWAVPLRLGRLKAVAER